MTNRTFQLLFSILLVSQLTGCFTIRSYFDELHYSRKIENRAEKIWGESKGAYRHVEHHLEDFGRGFVAGYESTAKGGDGCPPVLPPTRYWRTKYSNDVGKKHIVAWFDGYQHGAAAAQGDNAAYGRRLLTSQEIYQNCRNYVEYYPEDLKDTHPEPIELAPERIPLELTPPPLTPESAPLDLELKVPQVPKETPKYVPEDVPDETELLFPAPPQSTQFNPNIWRDSSSQQQGMKPASQNS